MIKRGKAPNLDLWSLPGGHVDFGESLENAARRELYEETGIKAGPLELVDLAEIMPHQAQGSKTHYVVAVFTGLWLSGNPNPGDDAADAAWFKPKELGELNLTKGTDNIIENAKLMITRA